MQSHAKSFTRIEPDWTVREGVSSLISNITCTKQSNLLLLVVFFALLIFLDQTTDEPTLLFV